MGCRARWTRPLLPGLQGLEMARMSMHHPAPVLVESLVTVGKPRAARSCGKPVLLAPRNERAWVEKLGLGAVAVVVKAAPVLRASLAGLA